MPDKIKNLVAERQQITERSKQAKANKKIRRAAEYGQTKYPRDSSNPLANKPPNAMHNLDRELKFAKKHAHHDPNMASWIQHIKDTNAKKSEALRKKVYGEEVTDETRRLAGIVESTNSSLLESRLSTESAEAKIYRKPTPKPAKA